MGSRWLPRLVAAGAAVGLFMLASPAHAEDTKTININSGNVPTTAANFKQECNANLGGGPYAGQDVWVFNLEGSEVGTDFVSVTAYFNIPGGTATKTITADGGSIVHIGTSKAFIALPAGWELTNATAVVPVSFNQDFFVLTHTCKASTSTSPSPSTSPSTGTPTPSPDTSPSTGTSGTPTPSESQSTGTTSASPSPTGGLPVTGTAVTGIVLTGVVLVGIGVGLVLLQRRRTLTDAAE